MSKPDKKAQLIEIAIEMMNRQGIKKTTLDDIAGRVGMTTPSLYYYFKNKNQLIKETIESILSAMKADIANAIDHVDSPELQIRLISLTILTTISKTQFVTEIDQQTKSEVIFLVQDSIDEFTSHLATLFTQIITNGRDEGLFTTDNEKLAAELIADTLWMMLVREIGKSDLDSIVKRIDMLMTLFLHGLKKS